MKITFRIECPCCGYGYPWSDNYVNAGWQCLTCAHCEKIFYTKISIPTVDVQISKNIPEEMRKDAKQQIKRIIE